ncbi:MAG: prepilin-type N-terminal cleavage/methylation domain-containing protein [Atopobiaceae bacterium]|nr:prepilin-type N-terminal cleavage/methylation domain-containing protein [Atopobiaceae bacterium]
MKHRRNSSGFTMMEMLIAVAVMVILMGVAFIAVINYQKSTKQLELDKTARELFIAAQNHLTVAQGQGLLKDAKSEELGFHSDSSTNENEYCFFVAPGVISSMQSTMLGEMLPPFSIDDTVRAGGSYVIQYDAKSGTVLNVFYSDQSNLSKHTFVEGDYGSLFNACVGDERENKDARLNYGGTIIGWYGGQDLGNRDPKELTAPQLKVINEERLLVEVGVSDLTPEGVTNPKIQIIMKGEKSGESVLVADVALSTFLSETMTNGVYTKQYVLDDITASGKHFAEQFSTLIPGENITLVAKVYSNDTLSTIAQSERRHTNSLFEDVIEDARQGAGGAQTPAPGASTKTYLAEISNIRHLENLDAAISGYDLARLDDVGATHARQVSDLRWAGADDGFTEQIAGSGGTANKVQIYTLAGNPTTEGTYAPVNPTSNGTPYKLNYDGDGYKVAGIKVQNAADAGMFGQVSEGELKNLKLADFSVATTAGNAGALAGTLTNTPVENVLAYNEVASDNGKLEINGTGNVGGLVGALSGQSITQSAAAVYVRSVNSSAGGLVGATSGTASIQKSYSGGHTVSGLYLDDTLPEKVGRYNVRAEVEAGGLVGKATGTLNVQDSYTTSSVYGKTLGGGLVGSTEAGSISNCYAIGKVGGPQMASRGAFVGTAGSATFSSDLFLDIVNANEDGANTVQALSTGTSTGITAADSDLAGYRALSSGTLAASPYDSTLVRNYNGTYPFKTVSQLAGMAASTDDVNQCYRQYGDWPSYETMPINRQGFTLESTNASQSGTGRTVNVHTARIANAVAKEQMLTASNSSSEATDGQEKPQQPANQATDTPKGDDKAGIASEQSSKAEPKTEEKANESNSQNAAPTGEAERSESATDEVQKQKTAKLSKTLKSVDGRSYTITIAYNNEAQIPQGAELMVAETTRVPDDWNDEEKQQTTYKDRPTATENMVDAQEMAAHIDRLTKTLDLGKDGRLMWNKLLNVRIVANGEEVVPAADVQVEVETNAMPASASDSLEAVRLDGDESSRLTVKNATGTKDGEAEKKPEELNTRIAFNTGELGEIALAQVSEKKFGWTMRGEDISVFVPRSITTKPFEVPFDMEYMNGLHLIELFTVNAEPSHEYGTTLWIKATMPSNNTNEFGGIACYKIAEDNKFEQVFDAKGAKDLVSISAGDIMALAWDSGYQISKIDEGDVTVAGNMPKGAKPQITNVTDEYSDPSKLNEALADANAKTLSAYGLTLGVGDVDWQPSNTHPLRVTVRNDEIDAGSKEKTYDVLRVEGDGKGSQVDATTDNGTVSFMATSPGPYVVVEHVILKKTLTASDGKTYSINVSYDSSLAGIPADVELQAKELEGKEYDTYRKQAQDAMGAHKLSYARVFDISLIGTDGTAYEPNANVEVSIQLADAKANDTSKVVHFGEQTEVITPKVSSSGQGSDFAFATDSFSVFVVGYTTTVGETTHTYNMAGEGTIALSDLLDRLGIAEEVPISSIKSVESEDTEAISVTPVTNSQDSSAPPSNWTIEAKSTFGEPKTLTLTKNDDSTVAINITSEAGVSITVSNTLTDSVATDAVDFTYTATLKDGSATMESYSDDNFKSGVYTFTLSTQPGTTAETTFAIPSGKTLELAQTQNALYDTSVKVGSGDAHSATSCMVDNVTENTSVAFTNTRAPICKVVSATLGEKTFTTISEAVTYINNNGLDDPIQMLRDYTMPSSDAVSIPTACFVKITTADTFTPEGGTATITRAADFTNGALFTNFGMLELDKITLDGNNREGAEVIASSPLIVNGSSGTVTTGANSTIQNAKSTGDGGAISSSGISVTLAGALRGNEASRGGAIYVSGGDLLFAEGATTNFENNRAANGGAIYYAGTGTVDIPAGVTLSQNEATQGGGAIYVTSGVVEVSGGTVSNNTAVNGGAIHAYAVNAAAAIKCSGGSISNNTASGDGGAIYINNAAGTVEVSGGSIQNNSAVNGGAIYLATGKASIMGAEPYITNNTATSYGGAVCANAGTVTVSGVISGNTAANGSAVYANEATVNVSGSITNNTATNNGGAIGVGSTNARLHFTGEATVYNNKLGTAEDAPASNVYLSVDSDLVINSSGLTGDGKIGVYVPGPMTADLFKRRGEVAAKFGTYADKNNLSKFENDRISGIEVKAETTTDKIMWAKKIAVEVRYLASYANDLPPAAVGQSIYTNDGYYPFTSAYGASELADELYENIKTLRDNLQAKSKTAIYGCTFANGATDFGEYLTNVNWSSELGNWSYIKRDGNPATASSDKVIIYYSEPAYITLTNNTDYKLTAAPFTVAGRNAINSASDVGYGYVVAKNNVTAAQLLPITAADLTLGPWNSIKLMFPGGCGAAYSITNTFTDATSGTPIANTDIKFALNGGDPTTVTTDGNGQVVRTGSTFAASGKTVDLLFGEPTAICKITDEHLFTTIKDAVQYVKDNNLGTTEDAPAVIEMLTDYMLPSSDKVEITPYAAANQKLYINFTTAHSGNHKYYDDNGKAIISRDAGNKNSFVEVADGKNKVALTLDGIKFDGKNIAGGGDGGAAKTLNCDVTITNCDFDRFSAGNGGAIYIERGTLNVTGSNYKDCHSTSTTNRQGGGAIWTSATSFTASGCTFDNCSAIDQGGAVFYRVDNTYSYRKSTICDLSDCNFTNCSANAAGGLEIDAFNTTLTNCHFTDCRAIQRNGGGFNVWIHDSNDNAEDTSLVVEGCSFTRCILTSTKNTGYGGALRSTTKTTRIANSTFTDNSSNKQGGAIAVTNGNPNIDTSATIEGCTITNCNASLEGGGIYVVSKYVTVQGGSIVGCAAGNQGGAIYHHKYDRNISPISTTIDNCSINNCTSGKTGGGLDSRAETVTIQQGTQISGCTAKGNGGGVYHAPDASLSGSKLIVDASTISGNTSSASGGGIYTTSNMTLQNGSNVLRNHLTSSTAGNAAGIYMSNGKTLTIGAETDDTSVEDTSSVQYNTVSGGVSSNVRLSETSGVNSTTSVFVNCNLTGNIYVVNAKKAGTQFGSSAHASPHNFTLASHAFIADDGSLYGVIDGSESSFTHIIWDAPPICKITDKDGHILYKDPACQVPAVYSHLDDSTRNKNKDTAFSVLRYSNSEIPLYTAENQRFNDDTCYVKMLVESFSIQKFVSTIANTGHTIVFTTAGKGDNEDGYPYLGPDGVPATIIRAAGLIDTLFTARGDLTFESITIDGGSRYGRTSQRAGALINMKSKNVTVTINNGTTLQNSTTSLNGGAIHIGFDDINNKVIMNGGTIRNCTAPKGGAVYVTNKGGSIFEMNGGTITGNTADTGAGIAVEGANSRLYFSGLVNVSGNVRRSDKTTCNVELNQDSNAIINSHDLNSNSYIGVYVPDTNGLYNKHGVELKPFGTHTDTNNLYCFVNDRNGLKGGILESAPGITHWVKILSLEISKKVVSEAAADYNEKFHFNVNLYNESINGTYGDITFTNGVANDVTIVAGPNNNGRKVAQNLPQGTRYTVTEVENTGYTTNPQNLMRTGTIGENLERTDVDKYLSTAAFTNTRKLGNLAITKTVDSNDTIDPNEEFEFVVALGDKTINGTYGEGDTAIEFVNGVANFALKNEGQKLATGLPSNVTYTVEEKPTRHQSEYYTTDPGLQQTGTIAADTTTTAAFVNRHVSDGFRKVILRKVGTLDNGNYQSKSGAKFRIYRSTWAPLTDEEYESDATGTFYVGTLAYGTYYVVETQFPDGYAPRNYAGYDPNNPDTWLYYELHVGKVGDKTGEKDADGNDILLDGRGTYIHGLIPRGAEAVNVPNYTYSLAVNSTNSDGLFYVGESANAILTRLADGTPDVSFNDQVTWETSDSTIAEITGTTPQSSVNFKGAGEVTIRAYVNINGERTLAGEATVVVQTRASSTAAVPHAGDGANDNHSTGYLTYKELNEQMWGGVNNIEWVDMVDANGEHYLALRYSYGGSTDYRYGVIYYNGTYYKAVDSNGADSYGKLSTADGYWNKFTVDLLGADTIYNDSAGTRIKWVPIDGPTAVPASESGPGYRHLETDKTSMLYHSDSWLNSNIADNMGGTTFEWEPFRDGCMVLVGHNWGDAVGVVWRDGKYYKAKNAETGSDTAVKLMGTSFSANDLNGGTHTYVGNDGQSIVWYEIPDPYNMDTINPADNPPEIGTQPEADLFENMQWLWSQCKWQQYRDGCLLAALSNDWTKDYQKNAPVVWYAGHYYKPTGIEQSSMTIGILNEGFYPSDLTDGQPHVYGYGSGMRIITWQLIK